jgi:hypothetical protein
LSKGVLEKWELDGDLLFGIINGSGTAWRLGRYDSGRVQRYPIDWFKNSKVLYPVTDRTICKTSSIERLEPEILTPEGTYVLSGL